MVVNCLPVLVEQIRAEIYMGTQLICRTPYVKSFNVKKSRSQASTTFNVTMELLGGTAFSLGQAINIKAGIRGRLKDIFTGEIEDITSRPVFGKPSYYSLTISGRGILSKLENKTFSRRLKSDGQGMFCAITGGPTNRPDAFKSLDKNANSGNQTLISNSPNPSRGQHSPLIVHRDHSQAGGGAAQGGIVNTVAGRPIGTGSTGTGGLGIHTHENLDEGGPAFGVYSVE